MARRFFVVLVAVAMTAGCAAGRTSAEVVSLVGPWAFHPGDDPAWAKPAFDDRGWTRIAVPKSWGRQGFAEIFGFAWYRTRVPARWSPDTALGVTIGKIDSAYEIYVGGQRLGGVGRVPPNPDRQYDRHGTYAVPASAREADGSLVVALRVWRAPDTGASAGGPAEGPFEAGALATVLSRAQFEEVGQLALIMVFALTAVYHLVLGALHPGSDEYGWFGLMALEAALYGFLRTQWKYELFDDFVLIKKVEHLMIYLLPATSMQFVFVYFRQPIPRVVAAVQALFLVAGAAVVFSPGLTVALTLLPYFYIVLILFATAGIAMVVRRASQGDPDARLVGLGIVALVATLTNDALVERSYYIAPRLGIFGFATLVLGMGVSLVVRFRRAVVDLSALRLDLEQRVEERTKELSAAYRTMEELALRDGLTGLLNRRALNDQAASGLSRAKRKAQPFAVAMVDIDHFKAINDTHGHAAGDRVLIEVAQRLTAAVRASDQVGRWGGEEFLVVLPESDREQAQVAAERLRGLIGASPMGIDDDREVVVSVSVGVAVSVQAPDSTIGVDAIIRAADEALYEAKATGRNRVVVTSVALERRGGSSDPPG